MAVNQEFYHHGVKGQKWGVRRYRNTDGSLTPAGKKRAAKLNAKIDKQYARDDKKANRYFNKSDKAWSSGHALSSEKSDKYFNIGLAKSERAKALRDVRKKEVETGSDYLEHRLKKGVAIASLTGSRAVVRAYKRSDKRTHADQYKARKDINEKYSNAVRSAKDTYKTERNSYRQATKNLKKKRITVNMYRHT